MDSSSILAVVAIGVSALTLMWTIGWSVYTLRRSSRPRLTVRTVFSVPVYEANQLGQAAVDVSATNTGPVTVTATSVAIEVKGRKETVAPMPESWLVQMPKPIPAVLEPGQHWNGILDAQNIIGPLSRQFGARQEWKIRAAVRDPAGNTYRPRKWMTLDVGAVGVFADGVAP